ncbi:MAG TPA: hydroxymethylbilane synthase [Candidatus Dormibacteraeota bacterium]|nr:hydroxymethylbilane synthase [Candidatus Dormibacteraeota bacterium]
MSAATQAAVLRLATRGSPLARAQAALAAAAIREAGGPAAELVVVRTAGDRNQTTPIDQMDGQGWFTAEIERALLDGRADIAVHAAKDLPTELADGLEVAAYLPRADPRDALVSRTGGGLESLPDGAVVGTSSARRGALLAELRPGLRAVPIRGNVDTRLRKLDEGEVDGLLLAAVGLDRLGLSGRIGERLDPRRFVPAPAQGAIALEVAGGRAASASARAAGHAPTSLAVATERALLRELGGGCLLPLGAWARLEGGALVLSAALGGGGAVRHVELEGDPEHAAELVTRAGAALR